MIIKIKVITNALTNLEYYLVVVIFIAYKTKFILFICDDLYFHFLDLNSIFYLF